MRKTGRVTVKFDGESIRSKPGASLQIGGVQRDGEMSDQGKFFYSERDVPSEVKCTLIHVADTDLDAIRRFRDGVVTFECDTGITYTVPNAATMELGELANGEVEVTFMGDPAEA